MRHAIEIPAPITTDRLRLRVPRPGDGAEVHAVVTDSLPRLQEWMDWAQDAPSVDSIESRARAAVSRFRLGEELDFYICLRSDGRIIGAASLHSFDWNVPRCEIGYWLRTDMEGRGYITEAVNTLTTYAFDILEMVRVEIRCDAENSRSAAVARRAGYELEGRLRNHRRNNQGKLSDTLLFARLRF